MPSSGVITELKAHATRHWSLLVKQADERTDMATVSGGDNIIGL